MAESDEAVRARIIDVAAELFAQYGFSGTKVHMVANAAGVSAQRVRRLTGDRADLFEAVITARAHSKAAATIAEAVREPDSTPALAVVLAVAQEVYQNPQNSWDILELEALTRAHTDEQIRVIERGRIHQRRENAKELVARMRAHGGLDADVSDDAIVIMTMALSVGLAVLDPVLEGKPSLQQWNGLIARIGSAMMPQDMSVDSDYMTGRNWRVRVDIPERPGQLARLVRLLGALYSYTVGVGMGGGSDGYRTIDAALVAPHGVTEEVLRAAVASVGRNVYVGPGSPEDAEDLPTRVLDGATAMVSRPELAPLAAAKLVEASSVEVTDATEGEDDSPDILRLQWTPDQHVVLQRSWAPFSETDRSRASAFLRLSSAIATATGNEEAAGWVESVKGGTVWIRLARPEDADAVAQMHDRCSEQSRYQRYFSLTDWHGVRLHRLSGGHRGATLVVMSEEGKIVGFGNVFPDASEGEGAAEVALIIEDDYQGRGIGTKLLQALIFLAMRLEFTEVVASVLADNKSMLKLLKSTGLPWETIIDEGVALMKAPLPPRPWDEQG